MLFATASLSRASLPFEWIFHVPGDLDLQHRLQAEEILDISRERILELNRLGFRLELIARHDTKCRHTIVNDLRDFRHLPARFLRELFPPERWDETFKFAFVRNPWDWVLSSYLFNMERTKPTRAREVARFGREELHEHLRMMESLKRGLPEKIRTQEAFLGDADGELLVDFVGRMECLNEDWALISKRLGLSPSPLPHLNANPIRRCAHYRCYYTDDAVEMVRHHYRADIERFGYEY